MNVFNPEYKEYQESGFEGKKFNPDAEAKLLDALNNQKETFPDIIQCPNASCATPLKVQFQNDHVELSCKNCGWHSRVSQPSLR